MTINHLGNATTEADLLGLPSALEALGKAA